MVTGEPHAGAGQQRVGQQAALEGAHRVGLLRDWMSRAESPSDPARDLVGRDVVVSE